MRSSDPALLGLFFGRLEPGISLRGAHQQEPRRHDLTCTRIVWAGGGGGGREGSGVPASEEEEGAVLRAGLGDCDGALEALLGYDLGYG